MNGGGSRGAGLETTHIPSAERILLSPSQAVNMEACTEESIRQGLLSSSARFTTAGIMLLHKNINVFK
jgi:hypothetical protein